MGQIVLIRHGQASFGAEDYDCLSELGVRQSQRLGQWLADRGESFGRVVTGSMQRHRQTAEACLAALPQAPLPSTWEQLDGLAEYDHEEVVARHRPDLADPAAIKAYLAASPDARRAFQKVFAEALKRWVSGHHDADYRESWRAFRQRCLDALLHLAQGEEDTVVFTSGGPISVICQHLLESPEEKSSELSFVLANCSLTRLSARAGRVNLTSFNNFSYLESAGNSSLVSYR